MKKEVEIKVEDVINFLHSASVEEFKQIIEGAFYSNEVSGFRAHNSYLDLVHQKEPVKKWQIISIPELTEKSDLNEIIKVYKRYNKNGHGFHAAVIRDRMEKRLEFIKNSNKQSG